MKRTGRLYLVRAKDFPSDPYALIFAKTVHELFWLVDECGNPFGCEYAALGTGFGMFWHHGRSGLMYYTENEALQSKLDSIPLVEPQLTECGDSQLCDYDKLMWREFTDKDCDGQ